MVKSALTELEGHIETLRRESYDRGYRAAMRLISDLATTSVKSKSAPAARATTPALPAPRKQAKSTAPRKQAKSTARKSRQGRGANAKNVAEALAGLPDRTGGGAEIRRALAEKGIELAYTSIRHACGQLQARGEATLAADNKTWTYQPAG